MFHLGDGKWLVVDSCVYPDEKHSSAAVRYLDSIGASPQDVVLIVATHWHDDHVRGLAHLVNESPGAAVVCSAALKSEQFLAMLRPPAWRTSVFSSGTQEMREVLEVVARRRQPVRFAGSAKRLLQGPSGQVTGVWTLTPSDSDIRLGIDEFGALLPTPDDSDRIPMKRVDALQQNDCSVVVLVELADGGSLLLGGDLEHRSADAARGWHAMISDGGRPRTTSELYKVAHHGSRTAHCEAAWGSACRRLPPNGFPPMLARGKTLCVVAPWRRGGHFVPAESDLQRLRDHGGAVHVTGTQAECFGWAAEAAAYRAAGMAREFHMFANRPGRLTFRYREAAWRMHRSVPPRREA